MQTSLAIPLCFRALAALCFLFTSWGHTCAAQEAPPRPPEKPAEGQQEKSPPTAAPELPAQIVLLETRVRFETDGGSRKEVHTRVHINSELGVRQFARLNFDYNRSFESVEIPLVRITHPIGGTTDILPSAIADNPNPAVVNAPAYQDVRVKSVRVLGLQPGDLLEYRVITTVTHSPFAPNFYLSHDFAHHDVVSQEVFEIDVPASKKMRLRTSLAAQVYEAEKSDDPTRVVYRWERPLPSEIKGVIQPSLSKEATDLPIFSDSDIALGTFDWADMLMALQKSFRVLDLPAVEIKTKAEELTRYASTPESKLRALSEFVSQKIRAVDLPVGATGFQLRPLEEVISSSYATSEEKGMLLSALSRSLGVEASPALTVAGADSKRGLATPSLLTNVLVIAHPANGTIWLDPSLGVAPFGMIASNLRGKPALLLNPSSDVQLFEDVPKELPFPASQRVSVDATLAADGKLTAKVHYSLRGDNELLLRVAFHEAPKENWKELVQLLSISDGFRGQVTSVTASDPYATHEPFTLDYEITQPKFVDWSKKIARIPALLPQLGLPDPPAKSKAGAATSPIELGTPLEVETRATLHVPSGTAVRPPTGTSVQRDYATYTSQYSVTGQTITASRHMHFLLREIPADRAIDYNAFLRAVQNDEAQDFSLDLPDASSHKSSSPNSSKP